MLVTVFLSLSFMGQGFAKSKSSILNTEWQSTQTNTIENVVKANVKEGTNAAKNSGLLIQSKDKNTNWKFAMTNANGSFKTKLEDGNYVVKAIKEDGNTWFNTNSTFTVEDGEIAGSTNEEIKITNKNKVSHQQPNSNVNVKGTLTDGEKGIKGELYIFNIDSEYEEVYSIPTNGNGAFSASLPDGNYLLFGVGIGKGYYQYPLPFTVEGKEINLNGDRVSSLELTLPKLQYRGSVSDSSRSLTNAGIILEKVLDDEHYDYEFIEYVVTNNKGEFQLRELSDGDYTLSIYHQTYSAWELVKIKVMDGKLFIDGKEVSTINIKIPDLTLMGTIFDGKKPLTNGYVMFEGYDDEGNIIDWYGTPVDKKGNFKYRLNDGEYKLIQVEEQTRNTYVSVPFEVRNGKLVQEGNKKGTLDVVLPPVTFVGQLVENGNVLEGFVYLEKEFDDYDQYESYYAATDSNGKFSLRLSDGFYSINGGFIFEDNGDFAVNASFEIRDGKLYVDGEKTSIFELTVPPVSLHGIVLDGDAPVHHGEILISTLDDQHYYWRWIEADGTFSMRLADGEYKVIHIYLYDDTSADLEIPFTINNGQLYQNNDLQEKLVITLPPITLTGTILDEGNLISGGVEVMSIGDADDTRFYWNWADTGVFKFRLPDGDYQVNNIFMVDGTSDNPSQEFSIVDGQLVINGDAVNELDITVHPVTLTGSVFSGEQLLDDGLVQVQSIINFGEQQIQYGSWINFNGTYKFRLPDGEYELYYVENYFDYGYETIFFNKKFTVQEGQLFVDGIEMDVLDIQLLEGTPETPLKES